MESRSPIVITTKEEGLNFLSQMEKVLAGARYTFELAKVSKNIPMYVEAMQELDQLEYNVKLKEEQIQKILDPVLH